LFLEIDSIPSSLLNKNENGLSGLHLACKEGYREIVTETISFLKKMRTDMSIYLNNTDTRGWSPLFYAIEGSENGFPEIVGIFNIT
jgi:ankyrin repeat protein